MLAVVLAVVLVVVVVCESEGVAGADSGAVSQQEGAALCALLHSTRGDSWRWRPEAEAGAVWNCSVDAAGGLVHNPCSHGGSSWQGVTCSSTPAECSSQVCQVTQLDLTSYEMRGPIPPEIGELTFLKVLIFINNQLTGSIPHQVGDLDNLIYLSLYLNILTGIIPPELGQLQALKILDLDDNPLTGTIPRELGNMTNLFAIYIGDNEITGSIPSELGQLQALEQLYLFSSHLTGCIPAEIGQLRKLKDLYLYSNQLTGAIPVEIGQLSALKLLGLFRNLLTGHLPVEVGQLSALEDLVLFSNRLSGPIPTEIGHLNALEYLSLYSNYLTGTIPVEVCQLTKLKDLVLSLALLTGQIPAEVGQLMVLESFVVHSNQLTGSVPVELMNIITLEYLVFHSNQFTGCIPPAVGQLTSLLSLYLHDNLLTGPIPIEIGHLSSLQLLHIFNNRLSGSIPDTIGLLMKLEDVQIQNNVLEGKIPVETSKMRMLRILFLQDNLLRGTLEGVFNYSSQVFLSTIDASNNRLSGTLFAEMFLLPQLQVLSLSVNCFDQVLPHSLCSAERVEVLSLNGLRAAEGCEDRVVVPISGVALYNTIGGSIPSCVWAMQNLSVVHLVGNGLSGELSEWLPTYSQLTDLSLSHNKLSGTIPLDYLKVAKLDLSFNQFDGEYVAQSQNYAASSVNLEINRLSGQLPVSRLEHEMSGSLNILRGNMFSCNTIPENDSYSRDYVCGSLHLNYSLIAFTTTIGLVISLLSLMYVFRAQQANHLKKDHVLHSIGALLWTYATYIRTLDTSQWSTAYLTALRTIIKLSDIFVEVILSSVKLFIVVMVGSVPIYLVKVLDVSGEYSTHSNTYSWFWTMAYMRGGVPAGLLLLLWTGAICACYCYFIRKITIANDMKPLCDALSHNTESGDVDAARVSNSHRYLHLCVAFLFNAVVTITVNALYIYSIQQDLGPPVRFGLQFSLSFFRLFYSAIVFPLLSRSIDSTIMNVKFRFTLLTINNLLIPCLVTILTSDACFQGLLIPATKVGTPYSYSACVQHTSSGGSGETICTVYGFVEVESAPLEPPFTYNNQCGSVLLTSYIPVLVLGYSLQLLLSWIAVVILMQVAYDKLSPSTRTAFHGLIWPEYWRQGGEALIHNKVTVTLVPDALFKIRTVLCNDVLNNWLLLLTFGLCSPILAFAIVCCVLLKLALWLVLVGRFTKCVLQDSDHTFASAVIDKAQHPLPSERGVVDDHSGGAVCFALSSLAQIYVPLYSVLTSSFWRLAWCSGLFVALLSWDMAADEVGWLQSLWVPVFPLLVVLVLRCIAFYIDKFEQSERHDDSHLQLSDRCKESLSNASDESVNVSGTFRSPLHVEN